MAKSSGILVLFFTVFYLLLLLFVEKHGGIGISSDSMYLLTAAYRLAAEQQFMTWQGEPIAAWTPFYSACIAVFYVIFQSLTMAALAVNVAAVLGVNFFFFRWLALVKMPLMLQILGGIWLNMAVPFFFSALFAWSDLLSFAVLVATYYVCFWSVQQQTVPTLVVWLAFSTLLFSRYAAVLNGVLLLGYLWYFSPQKLKVIAIALGAALPLGVWFVRNYYVTQTLSGNRLFLPLTWQQTALDLLQHLSAWWFPTVLPAGVRIVLVVGCFVVLFFMAYRYDASISAYFLLLVVSVLATWVFYALILTESIGERLLLPLLLFMIVPLLLAYQVIQQRGKRYEKWVLYAMAFFFVGRVAYSSWQHLQFIRQHTVHAYHDARWASNSLTAYVQQVTFEPDARIFSDNPEKLLIQSNLKSHTFQDFLQQGYYVLFDTSFVLPPQAQIWQHNKDGILLQIR